MNPQGQIQRTKEPATVNKKANKRNCINKKIYLSFVCLASNRQLYKIMSITIYCWVCHYIYICVRVYTQNSTIILLTIIAKKEEERIEKYKGCVSGLTVIKLI